MKSWKMILPMTVLICFGSVIAFNVYKEYKVAEYLANKKVAASPVIVKKVKPQNWLPTVQAIGFIEPLQGLDITPELTGRITSINFTSGQDINAGDTLIQLNDSVERANLAATKANLNAAQKDFIRITALVKKGNASARELDEAQAKFEMYQAQYDSIKSTIEKMCIKAPFAGKLGIQNVYVGQYIQPGTNIVHLEDISSVKIRFSVSQNDLAKLAVGQNILVSVDAFPNEKFNGRITAFESAVDKGSGTIFVQAIVPNGSNKLLSGMYAHVSVLLPEVKNQIIIPQTAIAFNLYGESVFVMQTDESGQKIAKQVAIKVAERNDRNALITSGLTFGDEVITEGQVRLSNGSPVYIHENYSLNQQNTIPLL